MQITVEDVSNTYDRYACRGYRLAFLVDGKEIARPFLSEQMAAHEDIMKRWVEEVMEIVRHRSREVA